MAFRMICTGGPYGDCCCKYDVVFDKECTVKEFVESVLEEKPTEWGNIEIVEDMKRLQAKKQEICEYSHGKIKENFQNNEVISRTIEKIIAHGGWTNMNYYIKCKQNGE